MVLELTVFLTEQAGSLVPIEGQNLISTAYAYRDAPGIA